jgi:hypothetical protein
MFRSDGWGRAVSPEKTFRGYRDEFANQHSMGAILLKFTPDTKPATWQMHEIALMNRR